MPTAKPDELIVLVDGMRPTSLTATSRPFAVQSSSDGLQELIIYYEVHRFKNNGPLQATILAKIGDQVLHMSFQTLEISDCVDFIEIDTNFNPEILTQDWLTSVTYFEDAS